MGNGGISSFWDASLLLGLYSMTHLLLPCYSSCRSVLNARSRVKEKEDWKIPSNKWGEDACPAIVSPGLVVNEGSRSLWQGRMGVQKEVEA